MRRIKKEKFSTYKRNEESSRCVRCGLYVDGRALKKLYRLEEYNCALADIIVMLEMRLKSSEEIRAGEKKILIKEIEAHSQTKQSVKDLEDMIEDYRLDIKNLKEQIDNLQKKKVVVIWGEGDKKSFNEEHALKVISEEKGCVRAYEHVITLCKGCVQDSKDLIGTTEKVIESYKPFKK